MTEQLLENIIIYGLVSVLCFLAIFIYLRKQRRRSEVVNAKILKAKSEGLFEPVSLHPVVDIKSCIQSGACIAACPEKDILGISNGKATTINASLCIGHGACFNACPTEAISLCIGTEKRGVDLPHVNPDFESNVSGIYIAGELGGMGLIKNALEQGKQAVTNIIKSIKKDHRATYDLIIIGAGPAGIGASLTAKKNNLKFLTLEQDTLGGTVFTYPRSKIVMTSAMDLPLYGKVKLSQTSKRELLALWNEVLNKNNIPIRENSKVEAINRQDDQFHVLTSGGEKYSSHRVLLAVGRRGSPRKLNIPGENSEKVAYRLLEPENISGKNVLVVGGGDSAVEAALALAYSNNVILTYRGDVFARIKSLNKERITQAAEGQKIQILYKTTLIEIKEKNVTLNYPDSDESVSFDNDLVYIFAGGELPVEFLLKTGIQVTKKFGEAILKHK